MPAASLDDAARRKSAEYVRQLRHVASDLRTKEFESSVDEEVLVERYHLTEPRP